MIKHLKSSLAVTSGLALLAVAPALAEDPAGVLWQMTSQMSMPGMPMAMPANTVKVCAAKEWKQPPPPPPGQTCTQSNFHRSGNKISWDQKCTGQMEITGRGEITFQNDDSYTGVIESTAEGMTMTIKLTGKKLGTCDKPIG